MSASWGAGASLTPSPVISTTCPRLCNSKIRVEMIHYFLKRYREDMLHKQEKKAQFERQLGQYEFTLRN
jgi:hypothetical protein